MNSAKGEINITNSIGSSSSAAIRMSKNTVITYTNPLKININTDSYQNSVIAIDTRDSGSTLTLGQTEILITRKGEVKAGTQAAYLGAYSGHTMILGDNSSVT